MISISRSNFDFLNSNEKLNNVIAKATENPETAREALDDYIKRELNPDQSEKLKNLLNDSGSLKALLSSPEAKNLLKKLTGGNGDE